jgi:type II secretory pathway component GspD/PulD (secretin)/uncharacterized low-complexity protein
VSRQSKRARGSFPLLSTWRALGSLLGCSIVLATAPAQEVELEATTVEVVEVQAATVAQPATMPAGPEASGATPEVQVSPAATPAGEKPDGETQAGEQKGEEAKAGEGKEGEKKDEKAAPGGTLARPTKPPKPADPKELEAKPDKNGRVEFSFNGQPWPDVLQWLAGVSGFSLDWQELPADYLNLSTQHSYTLPETRNLINSRLRDRGYTMLLSGDVLSVVKIDKVDPSLVPRVTEEDLYDLQPFDMVKLSFQLPATVDVAAVSEDLKKVLSTHAKVLPLPATRRVLIIDAVANLRGVSALLNEERLVAEGKIVPAEIVLEHRRAEKVIDILYVILGLDPATQPSQMDLQIQQQKMAIIQQIAGQGKDVSKMLGQDAPEVFIAFNAQRNSLLVNAPPEQLKIIERSISLLDVPTAGESASNTTGDSSQRIAKSYKLESIDPKSLLSTLEEIGDLSPMAELRADSRADILFCRCTAADHAKIEKMIEQLDGQSMRTVVFELRKHPADAVAGTLRDLFAPKKEEKGNDFGYYGYYSPWDYGYGQDRDEQKQPSSDLRVDADVENNRLFVRGSDEEIEQVRDFLSKIGESTDEQPRAERVRVVEALDPEVTIKVLERLRANWPSMGDNPLIIRGPGGASISPAPQEPVEKEEPTERAANTGSPRASVHYAVETVASDVPDRAEAERNKSSALTSSPEVIITITPDGRLLLSSEDTMALDRIEQMIDNATPPQRRFKVYQIDHVRASSIYLTLTGLYKEEIKGETPERRWDWRTDSWVTSGSKSESQLSRRKLLKIDYDFNSNTLLVANASPQQLEEIEELIREYDKPSAQDAQSRRIAAIKVEYSRATVIAAALKEVYRDLLSQRDKEFEKDEKSGSTIPKESTTILRFGSPSDTDDGSGERERPAEIGFQGALSVGVDEISNTIIVSAQEEVFDSVLEIIKALDEQAKPTSTVEVRTVKGGVSATAMQKALAEALGTPWVGDRPETMLQKPQTQEQNGEQNQQSGGQQPQATGQTVQSNLQIE